MLEALSEIFAALALLAIAICIGVLRRVLVQLKESDKALEEEFL